MNPTSAPPAVVPEMLPNAPMRETHLRLGAQLAPDGIPLHFGDPAREYHAAHNSAILLDRSHEGRLELRGRDALALLHRLSTNDMEGMQPGDVCPTLFTNPNGRILDRVMVYRPYLPLRQDEDAVYLITEPGRGQEVLEYVRRNIFFNDDVQAKDITSETRQFALHGLKARATVASVIPPYRPYPEMGQANNWYMPFDWHIHLLNLKPLIGASYVMVVDHVFADYLWRAFIEIVQPEQLTPAGGLAYNMLRIEAGRPAAGRELTTDYIPLEVGLWDEVSFTKGCYTGQEIIARMESRGKQAKTMLTARLLDPVTAPQTLYDAEGKEAGTLTSAVTLPPTDDVLPGEHIGIAIVKTAHAEPGTMLYAGENRIETRLLAYAGVQSRT